MTTKLYAITGRLNDGRRFEARRRGLRQARAHANYTRRCGCLDVQIAEVDDRTGDYSFCGIPEIP